jgi:hypothetical protein
MAAEKKKEKKEEEKEKRTKAVIKGEANVFVGGKQTSKEKWAGGKKVSEAKFDLKYYELTYDSFGESLEPIYYWLLDFLREDLGYEVEKTADYFAAA